MPQSIQEIKQQYWKQPSSKLSIKPKYHRLYIVPEPKELELYSPKSFQRPLSYRVFILMVTRWRPQPIKSKHFTISSHHFKAPPWTINPFLNLFLGNSIFLPLDLCTFCRYRIISVVVARLKQKFLKSGWFRFCFGILVLSKMA